MDLPLSWLLEFAFCGRPLKEPLDRTGGRENEGWPTRRRCGSGTAFASWTISCRPKPTKTESLVSPGGEEIRILYVAITRAKTLLHIGEKTARFIGVRTSALAGVIHKRRGVAC